MAATADGRTLVSGSGSQPVLYVWRLQLKVRGVVVVAV
jgi:hypothetical protein